MEPVITTLLTAFVIGAAGGAAKTGEQAILDAYTALKHIITKSYSTATDLLESIVGLEKKPASQARRDAVMEELQAVGASDNEQLVKAAEAVISAAENSPIVQSIGMDWKDVKLARLKINEIRTRSAAIGFRAARMEVTGEVEISSIDTGKNYEKK